MGHPAEGELREGPEMKGTWHMRRVRVTVTQRRREIQSWVLAKYCRQVPQSYGKSQKHFKAGG